MAVDSPSEFVKVYRFMTEGLGLSGADLLVYARVFSLCGAEEGRYYESRDRTARFLSLSVRQVRRSLARLEAAGLVVADGWHEWGRSPPTKAYRVDDERVREALGGRGEPSAPA